MKNESHPASTTQKSESHGAKRACHESRDRLVQIGEPSPPVYWKTIDELNSGSSAGSEFPGGLPGATSKTSATRRDFLALAGFSVAAAALTGCRGPVQNAIPLLVGSDEIIPGVANY